MDQYNSMDFPLMHTERLQLRELNYNDDSEILLLRSDEQVNRFLERKKQTSLEEAREFIDKINEGITQSGFFYWAINLKADPKLIGTICLYNFSADKKIAELGYELNPVFQKKGYMNEAVYCIIEFGFHTLHLHAIEAFSHKDNESSAKLLTKNNFKHDPGRTGNGNVNLITYILSRKEWKNEKKS